MATNVNFNNKVAIVTGASSGIGQATAILLAKKGASVVLCGRDEARLKSSVDQCVEVSGGNANRFTSVVGDVTKPEVRKAIVNKAVDTFERLDILVANAGVLFPEDGTENITEEIFDKLFDTNVKAVFFLIQAALPYLKITEGNIVNVSSLSSMFEVHGLFVYPMTKAAVDHMTRCLALEQAPKGIRVNAVNPTYIPTRMFRAFGANGKKRVELEDLDQKHVYGNGVTVEAVADTIAFLASDAAKFFTGQCHVVDGARHFMGANR